VTRLWRGTTKQSEYVVYILTNKTNTVLYTGVSGRFAERIADHKEKKFPGFTKRYNITKLVYFESFPDAQSAIAREKQIKAGSRQKKIDLIEKMNPGWKDQSEDLYA
jgi:putative endonuclease